MTPYKARKGGQLAMPMIASSTSDAIESCALRVAELSKLGRDNVDDGAIRVPAGNDRTLRVDVGCGIEGSLKSDDSNA